MGIEAEKSFDVLVDEFNRAGGLTVKGEKYKVEMVIYDDKYRADTGRAAVERLLYEDKVRFIVGSFGERAGGRGTPGDRGGESPRIFWYEHDKGHRSSEPVYVPLLGAGWHELGPYPEQIPEGQDDGLLQLG